MVLVVAPHGGPGGLVGPSAGCVVVPAGETAGRVGAGAWVLGPTSLCDTSRKAAWIGARGPSSAGQVGRVATLAWMLPDWVVMVSS